MRQIKFILVLTIIFSILFSFTYAEALSCSTQPVCGITPPVSFYGFGAVEICGECFACGLSDGVCPEDFTDGVEPASCRKCADPDCTLEVSGRVFPVGRETGIVGLNVYAFYASSPFESHFVGTTETNGVYSGDILSGDVTFVVKNEEWDSNFTKGTFIRGVEYNNVNLEVVKSVCNSDCTGSFGQYCKASCEGINNCAFQNAMSDAGDLLMTANEIALLCDYVETGNYISLTEDEEKIYNYHCCIGPVLETEKEPPIPVEDLEGISNLRSTTIPVTLNGQFYHLVINVWD